MSSYRVGDELVVKAYGREEIVEFQFVRDDGAIVVLKPGRWQMAVMPDGVISVHKRKLGRPREFRNAAEKQKAYRERKKQEQARANELHQRRAALRKSIQFAGSTYAGPVRVVECYPDWCRRQTIYKLMVGGLCINYIEDDLFQFIRAELVEDRHDRMNAEIWYTFRQEKS